MAQTNAITYHLHSFIYGGAKCVSMGVWLRVSSEVDYEYLINIIPYGEDGKKARSTPYGVAGTPPTV